MKKKFAMILLTGILCVSCCACQKENEKEHFTSDSQVENQTDRLDEEPDEIDQEKMQEDANKKNFPFASLENVRFVFSSGAGGWSTIFVITEDGKFSGKYSDSEMGDMGDGYPNGSEYYSVFKGKLEFLEQISEYAYRFAVKDMEYKYTPGTEAIQDEIRYLYTEAHGMTNTEEIILYVPGTPWDQLPEDVKTWISYSLAEEEKEEKLKNYAIHNPGEGIGFTSYIVKEQTEGAANSNESGEVSQNVEENTSQQEAGVSAAVADMQKRLEAVEKSAKEIETRLETESLDQSQLNQLSGELYTLWDDLLNELWVVMKQELSEERMNTILQAQRSWIKSKENEIKKAGEEYQGGSLQSMAMSQKGAELTRMRVYELFEMLK